MTVNSKRQHAAYKQGLSTFEPVGPCRHGHTSPRFTCNGDCVACKKIGRRMIGPIQRTRTDAERSIIRRAKLDEKRKRDDARYERVKENFEIYKKVSSANRRARLVDAERGCPKEYAAFVRWVLSEPHIECRWCHTDTLPKQRHMDHVIPLSRGGAHSVANLCVACPDCNLSKNAKLPSEWSPLPKA